MIETLMNRMFEPRYPRRYVGKHRAASTLPQLGFAVRRRQDAIA
ncbi:hypothetical protein F4553_004483 [Allocatelliglobosispora scoriae]|uniref:Uncharacterized protein n=1 Tax=Allocatelliglobosispora scoriae TaxID=643052 RepID=A0A841BS88_9ACTN|nr:hypothetical protein [Allocatelliglobosispora scoriae]MBB5871104.1 hypothetical protein [Allocatelliglobosispora scoriae]